MNLVALLIVQVVSKEIAPTFLALSPNMTSESTLVQALPGPLSVRFM